MKIIKLFFLSMLLANFTACTSKVTVNTDLNTGAKIVLLPIKDKSNELSPTRLSKLQKLMHTKLSQAGYIPVDLSISNAHCRDNPCGLNQATGDYFKVDTMAMLTITDYGASNFGIGKTSVMEGRLTVKDTMGNLVYESEEEVSDLRGIIFESGQVVKALREQASSQDMVFQSTIDEFVKELTAQLPKPKNQNLDLAVKLWLKNISSQATSPGIYRICASGPEASIVELNYNSISARLRPITSQRYCGIFNLANLDSSFYLTISDNFTTSDPFDIDVMNTPSCNLNEKLISSNQNQSLKIELQGRTNECKPYDLTLYRASQNHGPYKKVGKFNRSWQKRIQDNEVIYVFAQSSNGKPNQLKTFRAKN